MSPELSSRLSRPLGIVLIALTFAAGSLVSAAAAHGQNELDPARDKSLPCELAGLPTLPARSFKNLLHVANRCGIVGTDVEFQSRTDSEGNVHDYAFLGTMGYGFRIFDVTDPKNPVGVGGYNDTGWQNDIQVRGNIVVSTFDGVSGEGSTGSTCLKDKYPNSNDQGVDIFKLNFSPQMAVLKLPGTFAVVNFTCIANPPGGTHNATLHPSGNWLALSNCCSDWAIDVIGLKHIFLEGPHHRFRLIDEGRQNATRCPAGATFTCIVIRRPPAPALGSNTTLPPCSPAPCPSPTSARGLWQPHDIHFSRDGHTMYVAALQSTFVVNVRILNQFFTNQVSSVSSVPTISIVPNINEPPLPGSSNPLDNPRNISLSHQADVTADGKILVITDERGGGLQETRCNEDAAGVIGGIHFWALGDIGVPKSVGATVSKPKKLGSYFNPNPLLGLDPLQDQVEALPRAERACTSHVFRLGGNGTTSPGGAQAGFDGVSRLSNRILVLGWYGGGVWHVDFRAPSSSSDGIKEEPRSTWGNTVGWNVQPGSEAWSAKEYKGYIFAGDMLRGFDVYGCSSGGAVPMPVACPRTPS